MIINLRGTSGAGKSTIVTAVMSMYPHKTPEYIEGRKRPISYFLQQSAEMSQTPLRVLGHYEIACGGCDTIQKVDDTYAMVRSSAERGHHVLYEGIMVQDDVKRCIEVARCYEVHVIGLTTPLAVCLEGVQQRRDARGDDRPLDPKNTTDREKRVKRSIERLRAAGVPKLHTEWLDREQALLRVLELLGIVTRA